MCTLYSLSVYRRTHRETPRRDLKDSVVKRGCVCGDRGEISAATLVFPERRDALCFMSVYPASDAHTLGSTFPPFCQSQKIKHTSVEQRRVSRVQIQRRQGDLFPREFLSK